MIQVKRDVFFSVLYKHRYAVESIYSFSQDDFNFYWLLEFEYVFVGYVCVEYRELYTIRRFYLEEKYV